MSSTGARAPAQPAGVSYTAVITEGGDGWFCAQVPEGEKPPAPVG